MFPCLYVDIDKTGLTELITRGSGTLVWTTCFKADLFATKDFDSKKKEETRREEGKEKYSIFHLENWLSLQSGDQVALPPKLLDKL